MGRYDATYGTDWRSLDKDEAVERAYALGVAAASGEFHRSELEAIRDEMDTAYKKSIVDLAYEEGQSEATELADQAEAADEAAVWEDLVAGEKTVVDPEDVPDEGRLGMPDAVDRIEALDRPEMDQTEATDRPEFLDR